MQDLMDDTYDITEIMSRNYATPDVIDEEELLAELDDLEGDMLQDSSSYLDEISVPTSSPASLSNSVAAKPAEDSAMSLYQ